MGLFFCLFDLGFLFGLVWFRFGWLVGLVVLVGFFCYYTIAIYIGAALCRTPDFGLYYFPFSKFENT